MIIRRLLLLNGLAVIGAVVHHSLAWVLAGMFWWTDRYRDVTVPNYDQIGSASYFVLRFLEQLSSAFPVPAFLFVSGVFVAFAVGKSRKTLEWSLVFQRIKSLWIPYLLWSMLILGLGVVQGSNYALVDVVRMLVTGGVAGPYFYVPLITWMFLLSPFIVPLARSRWKLVLAATALVQVPGTALLYIYLVNPTSLSDSQISATLMNWHLPQYIFWFVLGCVVWFHQKNFKLLLANGRRPLLIALILVFVAGMLEGEAFRLLTGKVWLAPQVTLTGKIFALLFILTFLAYESYFPPSPRLDRIGGYSYGIYLSHVVVLEIVARGIYHIAPSLLGYPLLFLAVLTLAGLGVPLLTIAALNASPARIYFRYVFG